MGMHPSKKACVFMALVLITLLAPPLLGASYACGAEPGQAYLDGFTGATPNNRNQMKSLFYAGAEGQDAMVIIRIYPGDCTQTGRRGEADFETQDGSATQPSDYAQRSGTTAQLCADVHQGDPDFCPQSLGPAEHVSIPLASGGAGEPAVEMLTFALTGGRTRVGGSASWTPTALGAPSSAPVYVIDTEGFQRFSLEPGPGGLGPISYSHSEPFNSSSIPYSRMLIPIFRAGALGSPNTVDYQLVGTGANPATPGPAGGASTDVIVPATSQITFDGPNPRVALLAVDIKQDSADEPDETFEVRLTDPAESGFSATTVTIVDNDEPGSGGDDDLIAPTTRFHHPKHRWKYSRNSYRIREMHAFFRDNAGGSGVVRVQMALRRMMEGGSCAWWVGGQFQGGPCSGKKWSAMRYDGFDLYIKRFPALRPTQGTPVLHYTAWSRGFDEAANIESSFTQGRNANWFWIKR